MADKGHAAGVNVVISRIDFGEAAHAFACTVMRPELDCACDQARRRRLDRSLRRHYVHCAVMAFVHPLGREGPILLAGRHALAADASASLGADGSAKADYDFDRMLAHGVRRAFEIDEAVAPLIDVGIEPLMSRGTAARPRAFGGMGADPVGPAAKLAIISHEARRLVA